MKNWDGGTKWQSTTLMSMLENEKYKGDALLQKSYTVDFLTKKRTQNKGEIQMFYVEDDHDAIISKRIWECVHTDAHLYAGFPHLYFYTDVRIAERFVSACRDFMEKRTNDRN